MLLLRATRDEKNTRRVRVNIPQNYDQLSSKIAFIPTAYMVLFSHHYLRDAEVDIHTFTIV